MTQRPHHAPAPTRAGQAVVIGGSIAGLFAARVLADSCERVTIVDRDTFPASPAFRKGVPQSRHLHVLLTRGLEIAGHCFPGIAEELLAAGAVAIEWPSEALWQTPRGWMRRFSPGIPFVSASRELLEATVRQRVAILENVTLLDRHDVTGLLASPDGAEVAGVRLRARGAPAGAVTETRLEADLVVDASGRLSRAPEWLETLGYDRPPEERIDAGLGYASRDFAIPAAFSGDWKAIMLQAKPPHSARTGYLFQIAPGRWRVSLMGAGGDLPPTDEAGFLAFVRGLRSPLLAEVLQDAEPLTPIFGYRDTVNQRRYYERVPRLPQRFLALGDAVAAFNPIYGQGMTAAAQGAVILDDLLREWPDGLGDLTGLGPRFQRALAKANEGAWLIATGEDLRYPTTVGGERTLQTRLMHRYLDRVMRAATEHRGAHFGFLDVIQLVAPPSALFKPAVLLPALRRGGAPDRDVPPPFERTSVPEQALASASAD